jgi:hypothetical protein
MVAHYLDLPFVQPAPSLPLTFKCVMHHHWDYHPALDHSIYVIRDGRDVMVSRYMRAMRGHLARREAFSRLGRRSLVRALAENVGKSSEVSRRLEHLLGKRFDPWDVERNLPIFIEAEMQRPFNWAVSQPWPQHVRAWRAMAQRTTFVKYEELLQDGVAVLSRVLAQYLGTGVDEREIRYTVGRYSFRKQTGREPGTEDRTSFARKGIRGDWRNHFTREAAQVFDRYAGDLLIELDYEADHQWMNECRQGRGEGE